MMYQQKFVMIQKTNSLRQINNVFAECLMLYDPGLVLFDDMKLNHQQLFLSDKIQQIKYMNNNKNNSKITIKFI